MRGLMGGIRVRARLPQTQKKKAAAPMAAATPAVPSAGLSAPMPESSSPSSESSSSLPEDEPSVSEGAEL